MSGTSLTREDYCRTCGHTYIARYEPVRDVYRIGCPPERCDVVVEQITNLALYDAESAVRERYVARLTRLGVPAEQIAHLGDCDASEIVRYPTA